MDSHPIATAFSDGIATITDVMDDLIERDDREVGTVIGVAIGHVAGHVIAAIAALEDEIARLRVDVGGG